MMMVQCSVVCNRDGRVLFVSELEGGDQVVISVLQFLPVGLLHRRGTLFELFYQLV